MPERNNQSKDSGAVFSDQKSGRRSLSRKMILLTGAAVVVVVAAIIFGIQLLYSKDTGPTPEAKASGELVSNIKKKDSSAVYGQLSAEAQKSTDKKAIQALVEKISGAADGSMKEVESNAATPEPETPDKTKRVEYEIIDKDDKKSTIVVTLTKEGSEWKILNFYSSGP